MKRNVNFFSWIILLAAGLLVSITVTQITTQGAVGRLGRGNNQAAATITMNNRLQEMLNLSFELETKMLRGQAALLDTTRGLRDSLSMMEYNVGIISQQWTNPQANGPLQHLRGFVKKQAGISFAILEAIEMGNTAQYTTLTDSLRNAHFGDSIYTAALFFQKEAERDLAATMHRNKNAADQLSLLNRVLAIVALLSVLLLGTIIIRRQAKQLALIKDLEQAKKVALESAEAKDQFLANMSHEIRTPLNAIKGFGKILLKTPLTQEQQKYASIISTASENLLNIVNDILDFAKIETGNLVMKKKIFELLPLLEEIKQLFTPQAQEKELQLVINTDASLPVLVKSDPVRIRQILVNLLSNAIKFTNHGTVTLTVSLLQQSGRNQRIRFEVADTGVGIPAEKLGLIFERFEQLDHSFTRQQGGTGLGLAITRKLVDAFGGKITVRSEINKGSVFITDLELEAIQAWAETHTQALPKQNPPDIATVKILVAEDNRMNQLLVKNMLEQYKVQTVIAENGEEAIRELGRQQFDMVLMDVQMPVMDGLTATRFIREKMNNRTPVVAMTAHVLPGEREKCLASGMDEYLAKPIDEEELLNLLSRYFSRLQEQKTALLLREDDWLDTRYLHAVCNNDPDRLAALLTALRQELPEAVKALQQVIQTRDVQHLRSVLHHLRSTLSCLRNSSPPVTALEQLNTLLRGQDTSERVWKTVLHLVAMLLKTADYLALQTAEQPAVINQAV